jgi:hypothetical protein
VCVCARARAPFPSHDLVSHTHVTGRRARRQVTTLRERLRGLQFDLDAMAFSNEVLSQQVCVHACFVDEWRGRSART